MVLNLMIKKLFAEEGIPQAKIIAGEEAPQPKKTPTAEKGALPPKENPTAKKGALSPKESPTAENRPPPSKRKHPTTKYQNKLTAPSLKRPQVEPSKLKVGEKYCMLCSSLTFISVVVAPFTLVMHKLHTRPSADL